MTETRLEANRPRPDTPWARMAALISAAASALGESGALPSVLALATPAIAAAVGSHLMGNSDTWQDPPPRSSAASGLGHGFAERILGDNSGFGGVVGGLSDLASGLAGMVGFGGPGLLTPSQLLQLPAMRSPGIAYTETTPYSREHSSTAAHSGEPSSTLAATPSPPRTPPAASQHSSSHATKPPQGKFSPHGVTAAPSPGRGSANPLPSPSKATPADSAAAHHYPHMPASSAAHDPHTSVGEERAETHVPALAERRLDPETTRRFIEAWKRQQLVHGRIRHT